jgi:filamentous hemagglutinin family protein
MGSRAERLVSLIALVLGSPLGFWGWGEVPVSAQIIPDGSLGAEGSRVVTDVLTEAGLIDQIEGGATRGDVLFHSFLEFNVNNGQRVYFANPAAIDTILGRVTGGNASEIFGTLGVSGQANLYLINPNGLVFGPNAELDIRGAFMGSTTQALTLQNGYTFSAINPDTPPLLTVNSPVGLASWLPPTNGAIASTGNLSVGQDLTLAGNTLDLRGQLTAGGDLTLSATDTLTIRDDGARSFVASAGDNLRLQGNQALDIVALNHPGSGLRAGGDLILSSDQAVIGDAHYRAGGNFQVERVDGSPGRLTSPNDPVIEASGDVSFDSYTGASLHIWAGGSVAIGDIIITGPDTLANSRQETVTLSDGVTTVAIDGNAQPTLDIRAGTLAVGMPGMTPPDSPGFSPGVPSTEGTGARADITIGTIANQSGLVFLTNQYQPNSTLPGDIAVGSIDTSADPASGVSGGSVVGDSRGGLTFNTINVSGGTFAPEPDRNVPDFTTFDIQSDSGDVTLLAAGDLVMPFPSTIYALGLRGGAITLASDTAIIQENGPLGIDPFALSWIESDTFDLVSGGDVRLTAPSLLIGGNIYASNEGDGRGGDVILTSTSLVTNQATIATRLFGAGTAGNTRVITDSLRHGPFSTIGSANFSFAGGQGGDVTVEAESLLAEGGAQITSAAFGFGDAGDVTVSAQDISLSGFLTAELAEAFAEGAFTPTAISSTTQPGAEGNSGNVSITTDTLSLDGGAAIFTQSLGIGDAGDIAITASESVTVDGAVYVDFADTVQPTAISAEIAAGAIGQGGSITIAAPVVAVTGGGTISAVSDGDGDAGDIAINASESVTVDGLEVFSAVGQRDRPSQIAAFTAENATGNGGTLTITTPSLSLTNNGQLTAETLGVGNAGNIKLVITGVVLVDGDGSGILSNTAPGSTGNGGSIDIDPLEVIVQNGGQIAVNSQGTGQAGDLSIVSGTLILDRGLISAETLSSAGGNITLDINDVIVLLNNSRISTSAGTALAGGDGGNIDITTTYLVAEPNSNSDITANAFSGAGGNVLITAQGIFGLTSRSRAELETLLGTSDPALLDPAQLPSSDITAISRGNPALQGQVIIQSPEIDPNQGTVTLPDNVVDASRLIAQGCSSGGTLAQEIGSLVVTGRGGLPPSPTESLNSSQVLVEWATGATGDAAALAAASPSSPRQLTEVQALFKGRDGQVALVAAGAPQLPVMTCAGAPLGTQP